ncbi:enoyl-CoA hydratase-related protein [Microbulbifer sp. DLAB2-AF]|uniref:enoyl-CoA hydratase-related protein n=1 Tax=Microbulbifer sp. DLAB2-AF TaxID=3243395 RepID=UPI0040397D4C
MTYETILWDVEESILTITLNRPEVHNCLNDKMVLELEDAFKKMQSNKDVRLIIVKAKGRSFCAGADLNDMKRMVKFTKEENVEESTHLSRLMEAVRKSRIPTLALVQGPVYGGGCGLVACCDVSVASPAVTFCFSEVKLGLIPAVISPYIWKRIGAGNMRRYFITAEMIDAYEARRIGLVHTVVQQDDLHAEAERISHHILNNSPAALRAAKDLIDTIEVDPYCEKTRKYTIEAIADIRVSKEGQEGLSAFFEKRPAAWRGNQK